MTSFINTFNPPSPAEAAEWALDPYDAENRRRGTTLLQNAPWGGSDVYVRLYRDRVESETDPQVLAISIRALGRWGTPEDAVLISTRLRDRSEDVRWEAAKALQRLHNPEVVEALAQTLVNEDESDEVRTAVAIALGQYPTDRAFQALAVALDARELSVNEAARWSLEILTGERFGLDRRAWLAWYRDARAPFRDELTYVYPVYQRKLDMLDYLAFWDLPKWETPAVPIGMKGTEARGTYDEAPLPESSRAPGASAAPQKSPDPPPAAR